MRLFASLLKRWETSQTIVLVETAGIEPPLTKPLESIRYVPSVVACGARLCNSCSQDYDSTFFGKYFMTVAAFLACRSFICVSDVYAVIADDANHDWENRAISYWTAGQVSLL